MVINRQRRVRVALKPLERFVGLVRQSLHLPKQEVTVCLVSDATIARMNRAFRGRRGSTDVLSFPANGTRPRQSGGRGRPSGRRTEGPAYLGDMAISPQAAQRNAHRFGRALPQELRILILHGMLHLCGYDHETDHGEMNRLERRLQRRLGLS
jgi:probable rRNA maturation factor